METRKPMKFKTFFFSRKQATLHTIAEMNRPFGAIWEKKTSLHKYLLAFYVLFMSDAWKQACRPQYLKTNKDSLFSLYSICSICSTLGFAGLFYRSPQLRENHRKPWGNCLADSWAPQVWPPPSKGSRSELFSAPWGHLMWRKNGGKMVAKWGMARDG